MKKRLFFGLMVMLFGLPHFVSSKNILNKEEANRYPVTGFVTNEDGLITGFYQYCLPGNEACKTFIIRF
jgi:hypothetical protein